MKRVTLAILLAAGTAGASGLSAPYVGTTESSPVHADPAAVHWNPALLTELGRELMPSLGAGVLNVRYDRERLGGYQYADSLRFKAPVGDADLDASRSGPDREVSAREPLVVPAVFGALPLSDDVVLGAGVFAPFAAILNFPADGPQQYSLRSVTMAALEIAPAVGWRVDPRLSLGAGASLVLGYAELSRNADLAGTSLLHDTFADPPIGQPNSFGPDAPSQVRELDVLGRSVTIGPATGLSYALRAGLSWTPDPAWRLGLSYIYRGPLTLEGPFTLNLDDPLFTHDLAAQGLRYPAHVKGRAELDFPLPSSAHAGLRWQATRRLAFETTGAWFRYSVVKSLDARLRSNDLVQPELGLGPTASMSIPRRWKDSGQVDLRTSYELTPEWRVGGLAGYHSPVSPDETLDVASPDGHRLVAGLIGGWRPGPVEWTAGLQLQYVLPRETRRSDYDLANGTYDLLLLTADVGARIRFD
jgi:long-chain fatty acid transport protein